MARLDWTRAKLPAGLSDVSSGFGPEEIGVRASRDDIAVVEERQAARAAVAEADRRTKADAEAKVRRAKAAKRKSSLTHKTRLAAWKAKRDTTP